MMMRFILVDGRWEQIRFLGWAVGIMRFVDRVVEIMRLADWGVGSRNYNAIYRWEIGVNQFDSLIGRRE